MKTTTTKTASDLRDDASFPICCLLAMWVTFFGLATVASAIAFTGQTTVLGCVGMIWCVVINGGLFVTGCRWVVQFVTGKK